MNTTLDNDISAYLARELDPAFAARAGLILRHIQPAAAGPILDLGCGRGFYAKAITTLYPQAAVAGADYSSAYLATAAEQLAGTGASLARADARTLPFGVETFAAVVCSEVLEHIAEDALALSEIHRVLTPGGLLLASVPHQKYPFLWDPLNWVLERAFRTHIPSHIWWLAGIWADHVRLYTAAELSRRVRAAGFVLDDLWFTTPRCLPFAHLLLYGIGKNIVERGLCGSCNRFNREQESSRWFTWARRLVYAFDDPKPVRQEEIPSVGIVIKARKGG